MPAPRRPRVSACLASRPDRRRLPLAAAACAAFALPPWGTAAYARQNPAATQGNAPAAAAAAPLVAKPTPAVQALLDAGTAAQNEKRFADALALFGQAVEAARKAGDTSGEAHGLYRTGYCHYVARQPEKALEFLARALPLFRQIGSRVYEADTLVKTGLSYGDLRRRQEALDSLNQALPLLRRTGDKAGEASTLSNLGLQYSGLGESQKALDHLGRAAEIFRQTGMKSREAATLGNMGNLYNALGQRQQALDHLGRALAIFDGEGDSLNVARSSVNIGSVLSDRGNPGDYDKALYCFEYALGLFRKGTEGYNEAGVLTNIGVVANKLGQRQKALDHYEKALALHRQSGDTAFEANTLTNMGVVYSAMNEPQKALDYYEQALPLHRQVGDKEFEAHTLKNIGIQHQAAGRFAEAEARYREALAKYEQIRAATVPDGQVRAAYLGQYLAAYKKLAGVLILQGTPAKTGEAFAVVQQMKGRSLLELMDGGKVALSGRMTEAERARERELRAACDRLGRAMVAERVRNAKGSRERFEQAEIALGNAERELSRFTDSLYARYPDLAPKRAARTATLADVGAWLPENAALLEWVTLHLPETGGTTGDVAEAFGVFAVTRDAAGGASVTFHRVGGSVADVSARLADLRAACSDPAKAYRGPARDLYRTLLGPAVEERLAGKTHLVLCPDGALWGTPLAVLADDRDRTLLARFTVAYAHSATAMGAATAAAAARRASASAGAPAGGARAGILALADPDFGGEGRLAGDGGADAARVRAGRIEALPGTRKEAESIRRAWKEQATVLTGAAAREDAFKREAATGRYRFLHLATHGIVNPAAPLQSSVVLSQPPKSGAGSEEDGFLTARELFDLDLSAVEMTVLSACDTARGKNQAGEGVVGLTWALFAAGCPTQVLSQWAVNDASTATLMGRFYEGLKEGKPKAEALRQAALSVSRESATAHPFYWAPFVLFGDGG